MKTILAYMIFASIVYGTNALAKRSVPPSVDGIEANSVVYSAPPFVSQKNQNGGYIEARDRDSNRLLWRLKVYETEYYDKVERDVQDVFITAIELKNSLILVTDEKGRVFSVDLKTRGISRNK